MSQDLSPANLRTLAQLLDMGNKAPLMGAVRSLIEDKPIGESSLDCKIVLTVEGVSFTEQQLRYDRMNYCGRVLRRHRNGGGCVPVDQDEHDLSKPFVAVSAYVGPFAMVYGNARVSGSAHVSGSTCLSGDALVRGDEYV